MNYKKYNSLDGLRAISCLGIISMHVLSNASYSVSGFFYEKLIPNLTNLVFLFMTISAFGMCCGYYEKIAGGNIDFSLFYKKRYEKILPFFALLCLFDFCMSPSLNAFYEVFANLTLCFGFIPNANITVIGVGWFLGVVFAFYIIFPFFCFLLMDKKRAWVAALIAYGINYLCRNYFDAGRSSIAYCFVFFMIGGLIYIYIRIS
jgi:peptidoglycan/LPS O-acetylase OafA/YrhL